MRLWNKKKLKVNSYYHSTYEKAIEVLWEEDFSACMNFLFRPLDFIFGAGVVFVLFVMNVFFYNFSLHNFFLFLAHNRKFPNGLSYHRMNCCFGD